MRQIVIFLALVGLFTLGLAVMDGINYVQGGQIIKCNFETEEL